MKKLKKLLMLFHCMLITIVHAERLTLTPELTNSSFRLHWQNNAVLQTSSDLLQWHDLRTPTPYNATLEEVSAFYRLRLPDYLLINNLTNSSDAALLDWQGHPVHIWTNDLSFGGGIYLLEDRTLLKPGRIQNTNPFAGGGVGGNLRLLDWNSNVLWDYNYYSPSNHCAHHDIEPLPNGNLLLIAWEYITTSRPSPSGATLNNSGTASGLIPSSNLNPLALTTQKSSGSGAPSTTSCKTTTQPYPTMASSPTIPTVSTSTILQIRAMPTGCTSTASTIIPDSTRSSSPAPPSTRSGLSTTALPPKKPPALRVICSTAGATPPPTGAAQPKTNNSAISTTRTGFPKGSPVQVISCSLITDATAILHTPLSMKSSHRYNSTKPIHSQQTQALDPLRHTGVLVNPIPRIPFSRLLSLQRNAYLRVTLLFSLGLNVYS